MQDCVYVTGQLYPLDIKDIISQITDRSNFVLLETSRVIGDEHTSYLFKDPISIIRLTDTDINSLTDFDKKVEQALKQGYYLAGWWCYELGYLFEKRLYDYLKTKRPSIPLACLGVFKDPIVWDHSTTTKMFPWPNPNCSSYLKRMHFSITKDEYIRAINQIKRYISNGDTYQVNYTFKGFFEYLGDPIELYLALRAQQAVSYSALLKLGDTWCLSLSPELFIRIKGDSIYSRPMKGTIGRGRYVAEDIEQAIFLKNDPKNRAENVMIVDLLRNDIGKKSLIGSVKVPELFLVERYETLFQMTSKVEGRLPSKYYFNDILRGLFPCGSVTGAPKIRTMEIIAELEKLPRQIYTGSVGFISPKKEAVLNVAIRTIVINEQNQKADIGIGSGVTIDSDPESEYEECLLKARFLERQRLEFSLIETILFVPNNVKRPFYSNIFGTWPPKEQNEFILLDYHVKRLSESAHFFGFSFEKDRFLRFCNEIKDNLRANPSIIRILLHRDGSLEFSTRDFEIPRYPVSIKVSDRRVNTTDVFLYHKTTNRGFFDKEFSRAKSIGIYDFIFLNEKDEVSQGTITNIIIKKGDKLFTPPITSGLLNGCMRSFLLSTKQIKEKRLFLKDLYEADELYVMNSVRGVLRASLIR